VCVCLRSHQSKGFYGGTNSTRVLSSQTPGPEGRIFSRAGTSFDALVQEIAIARDMVRSAPTVSAPNNTKHRVIALLDPLVCTDATNQLRNATWDCVGATTSVARAEVCQLGERL
jgi:hypothetical protein